MAAIAASIESDSASARGAVERALIASPHRGTALDVLAVPGAAVGTITKPDGTRACSSSLAGWVAAVHGTIDNSPTLSAELGCRSDAASIVLATFLKRGVEGIGALRGTFAFVATNGQRLLAARDHLGSKPLHYREDRWGLIVATEAKQIVAGRELNREPNLDSIARIFYRGTSDDCALKGARRVPGASVLDGGPGRVATVDRHWDPQVETSSLSVTEAIETLKLLLEKVLDRMVTGHDFVSLSGGIDSSAVAAFAAEPHLRYGRPLGAFTVIYPKHRSVDESNYTTATTDYLGLDLETMEHSAGPLQDLTTWVRIADGPWDTLPAAMVEEAYRFARSCGAETVMTGELAEYVTTMRRGLMGHLLLHGRLGALRHQIQIRRAADRTWAGIAKHVLREITPAWIGWPYSKLTDRTTEAFPVWIDPASTGGHRYRPDILTPARTRWENMQLSVTRGTNSAIEVDELIADVAGVTVRKPLVDRDLWEFFLALPAEVKFPDLPFKTLVREAMRGRVPDSVVDRTDKTTFDEHVRSTAPYRELERWIDPEVFRMPGVNYTLLAERLTRRELPLMDLAWAKNLARAHAFIDGFN